MGAEPKVYDDIDDDDFGGDEKPVSGTTLSYLVPRRHQLIIA